MVHLTLIIFIRNFSLLIVLILPNNIFSCGWSETSETARLALFRASLNGFEKLDNYIYSDDKWMNTGRLSNKDQILNCKEWIDKLKCNIKIEDIYEILYKTNSEDFENHFINENLKENLVKNSFIKTLKLIKNKKYLKYVLVAKNMEYSQGNDGKWENWNFEVKTFENISDKENLTKKIDIGNLIENEKDDFLKQRYAFLALRQAFYNQDKLKVEGLYEFFFRKNTKSILTQWAKYYCSLSIENKALANYNLSQVLVSSDDKCNASIQHYDDKLEIETLEFAKNDTEKGIIKSITLLYNPGPILAKLSEIASLIPNDKMFAFLVQREVNKIEDWIFSPKYGLNYRTSIYLENGTNVDYEKARAENLTKDLKYLEDFKSLLISTQLKTSGEQKDFLNVAIAQLCFINDEIDQGSNYTNAISDNANSSIQLQKNIQLSLIALKQNDIKSKETQQKLYNYFNEIENAVELDNTLFKSMYTLYRIASKDFLNKKDVTTAGLLYMKSKAKQYYSPESYSIYYGEQNKYYYEYIGYFDRNAQPVDLDILISLVEKNNKTDFEKYICSGNINQNTDIYRDLKGTIAFRNDDLELAQSTFAEIDVDFWKIIMCLKLI